MKHGMVRKVMYPVLPLKAEYSLTSQGESMLPIIDAMELWGTAHSEEFWARLAARF
ncbi:winged helix-turn-helix transcriptional regulator [uncultured Hymenobacter sp.]|uniref:winged helix-turn-helix transcriptional regulator n=1 Tax=uncultured Hymenobacter sp. TaxID=170016 RepID=UPI0035C96BBC